MSTIARTSTRMEAFDLLFNFRDLGGYPVADGRRVRWGRLFRSDSPHQATDADLVTLAELGVRTVVDLRTHVELAERGRYPLDRHPVRHHHLPLISRTWEDDVRLTTSVAPELTASFLTARYVEMLADGRPALTTLVGVLADPAAYPTLFHCAVGKDRTGVIAAMVLDLLGVADDQIVHDYTLSALGMARIEAWLVANDPHEADAWLRQPRAWLASPPAAMASFLDHLRGEYGSTEGYLSARGVDPAVIEAVRRNLLH